MCHPERVTRNARYDARLVAVLAFTAESRLDEDSVDKSGGYTTETKAAIVSP
ncbi:MAG: hypothetical protein M3Q89_04700 [Verrucomicrobiota bacterium]|nr:hypothetical protein [Verrucomicrobiota bacterium]